MTDASSANGPVTVVLVHGAFADASSWNGVTELLQAAGVTVSRRANPLRGIAADSAYVASVLSQIPGPVLAVGHSYGGAVITNAATSAGNVVGLVYVAAFAPTRARRWARSKQLDGQRPERRPDPAPYPTGTGTETAVELSDQPGVVPRRLRRRPAGGAGRA